MGRGWAKLSWPSLTKPASDSVLGRWGRKEGSFSAGGLCRGNIRRTHQMDSWTTSKAFSHFFSFLPTLLPLTHTHWVYLFPAHLQSGCSKLRGWCWLPTRTRRSTGADALHVLAAAGKVLGEHTGTRHIFLLQPRPTLPINPFGPGLPGYPSAKPPPKPFQAQPGWNGTLHKCAPSNRQDITQARHGACCSYRPSNATFQCSENGRGEGERRSGRTALRWLRWDLELI